MGIFQRDGARVASEQLRALVEPYGWPGADFFTMWTHSSIGFGHAAVRPLVPTPATASLGNPRSGNTGMDDARGASAPAQQPTVAGLRELYITADVRLDSRAELRGTLRAAGIPVPSQADDTELLLHAYAHWDADCVSHLRGDFAFAIWRPGRNTLFCARDHFGIKPFYYALCDSLFLFSNSLEVLRRHPHVSATLNDSAVADFLLFGLNCDNATTTFRDVQRLPPAHSLLVSAGAAELRCYWEVPVTGRIRYARSAEYVENFLAVWDPAVTDRLDATSTGILLSGGLDSAAVAATAKELEREKEHSALRAFTIAPQNAPADRDPQFAAALADSLVLPLQIITTENLPFARWDDFAPISPEPVDDPFFAALRLSFQQIASTCRVVLSGEGSDNLMHFEMWPYARDLLRGREWWRFASEVAHFAWRRPFPWRGLRVRAQKVFGKGELVPAPFPDWIADDFAARYDLRARWHAGQPLPVPPHRHPIHPTAHASLYLPQWTRLFELESPGVTKCPVDVRYPFLDLRVVEYLLAIPAFPWAFEKHLLREAMASRVLDSIRLRPKTAYASNPLVEQTLHGGAFGTRHASNVSSGSKEVTWAPEAEQYIRASRLSPLRAKMKAAQVDRDARPFSFNFWLQSVRRVRYN